MRLPFWIATLGVALVLLLAACGDDDSGDATTDPSPTAEPTAEASPDPIDDGADTEATPDGEATPTEEPAADATPTTEDGEDPEGTPTEEPTPEGTPTPEVEPIYAAYDIYICDEFFGAQPPIAPVDGIEPQQNGLIQITPDAGLTLGDFAVSLGIDLSADDVGSCGDEAALLQVAKWTDGDVEADPEVFTTDLESIAFEGPDEVYTIAVVPEGAEIPPPPSVENLADPETIPAPATVPPPPEGATIEGPTPCPPADGSAERTTEFAEPPPDCLEPDTEYVAVFDTSEGEITVALDTDNTPQTVNNFVVLSRYGYYDDTALFRTDLTIDIIQGGAPHTNSANDPGPGYTIPDEGADFTYVPGQLVMARTSEPDSAGAQFFFTAGERSSNLDAQGTYVVFGEVTEGLDVLESILAMHVDSPAGGFGGPQEPVVVDSVTIEQA